MTTAYIRNIEQGSLSHTDGQVNVPGLPSRGQRLGLTAEILPSAFFSREPGVPQGPN